MKKIGSIILSILFVFFIVGFGFVLFVLPDDEVSEVENRSLTQFPSPRGVNVMNGEFTEQFDSYVTDQFPLRNTWIKSYLKWQMISNQTFVNDYYIKNDWVYPKPFDRVNREDIHFAADNIKELSSYTKKKDIELYFFSLPDRRNVLEANYPKWVDAQTQKKDKELFISLINNDVPHVIDIKDHWDKKWDQDDYRNFYFRTDHHWNIDGAIAAYEVISNTWDNHSSIFNDGPFDINNYRKECVSDKEFFGIYNRQLFQTINPDGEMMCYYLSKHVDPKNWEVYIGQLENKNEVAFDSIYGKGKEMDEKYVTYSDIYTTDYDEVHIINPEKEEVGAKILILKDSYANPLLPHIAEHFYHTTIYDVRHNEGENLYEFIDKHNFDMISLLYSNGRTLDYLYDFNPKEPSAFK